MKYMRFVLILFLILFGSNVSSSSGAVWGWFATENNYEFELDLDFPSLVWEEGIQQSFDYSISYQSLGSHPDGDLESFTYELIIYYESTINPVSFFLVVDNAPDINSGTKEGTTTHTPPVTLSDNERETAYVTVKIFREYASSTSTFEFGVGWVQIADPLSLEDITMTETVYLTQTTTEISNQTTTETEENRLPINKFSMLIGLSLMILSYKLHRSKSRDIEY
ncbi:MAG: hypothetical protein GPJ54_12675 [Candidatus Heimdallarchaeota archaeon]|nr:hypothetical protein [Candidatus Heimdallarchaeota archaeon]